MELKEYDNFIIKRKSKEKNDENKININENGKKVDDLISNMNNIRLINIKRSEPSNNDDDIKIIEEDFTKEKNI